MESSNYLTLGLTLIGAGFLLLAAELFIPTGGVLFVLSVSGIAVGVVFAFLYDTTVGLFTLLGVVVAVPALGSLLLHYWPRTPIGRRFFLTSPDEDATVAALPANQELEQLKGRFGRTLSALRPAGVVDFDGRRIDTITEGMMVDPGQWVRCIDVRAGKVVVRPVDRPDLGDLESAAFQ
jgi:membrane-bound serine protease (ClpP class)